MIMCEVHDGIFFCIFQLFKVHGEMLILETAPGQACVALTLLPFWFWQCDSCNTALGLKEQVQKCVCVDMDTNKSLNFDVSLSMPVLFSWIYWQTKRAERLEDREVVTSLSV